MEKRTIIATIFIIVVIAVVALLVFYPKKSESKSESDIIREQFKSQINYSLPIKKISLPTKSMVAQKNKELTFSDGIKNVNKNDLRFKINMTQPKDTRVTHLSDESFKFIWNDSEQILRPQEPRVYQIKFITKEYLNTSLFRIEVWDLDNKSIYDQKTFFIKTE